MATPSNAPLINTTATPMPIWRHVLGIVGYGGGTTLDTGGELGEFGTAPAL